MDSLVIAQPNTSTRQRVLCSAMAVLLILQFLLVQAHLTGHVAGMLPGDSAALTATAAGSVERLKAPPVHEHSGDCAICRFLHQLSQSSVWLTEAAPMTLCWSSTQRRDLPAARSVTHVPYGTASARGPPPV
jgi:hypothetical protein